MEPLKWSVYFQNPEFMEMTRMTLILPEMEPLVRRWCGVTEGANILDVGCGTGFFTRLLARGKEKVTLTGLDREDEFIAYATEKAREEGYSIRFLEGDALNLPFPDNTFDVVTSHTFLTSIVDPERCFSEMKRVTKPGGLIASVTCMSFLPSAMTLGDYPPECVWREELHRLMIQVQTAYQKVSPVQSYAGGLKPSEIPKFFAKQGMEQVSAYPLGKFNSLSNAAMPEADKRKWIDLYQLSEIKKLDVYMELPQMRALFTEEQAARYKELVTLKCDYLRTNIHENAIWEWMGGANLLVTGIVPKEGD